MTVSKLLILSSRADWFRRENAGISLNLTVPILEEIQESNPDPSNIAIVYAGLGEIDKAFEWLELSVDEYDPFWWSWSATQYDPLRDDPRFTDLLLRMNLEP